MPEIPADSDLVALFTEELRLCRVQPGETVLIFTDPEFIRPDYPPAAFAAARVLGADAYILTSQTDQQLDDNLVRAAWSSADLILGMSMVPRGIGSWMYTETHNEALRAGARVLMVQEPLEVLRRMLPTDTIRRRGRLGAQRLQEAAEIRITDDIGSDFTLRKDGRKGMYQCGIADEPGRWDHFPSGLVTCAPLEDSAEGTYVIRPGDSLLGLWRHAAERVTLTLEKGLITRIEGGRDADELRGYLERVGDDGSFRFSHAGWGIDDRCDWNHNGMDTESLYGTVMVSIGSNIFDAPAAYSGMGGKNLSKAHFDICCRRKNLSLDGELIVRDDETFAVADLDF